MPGAARRGLSSHGVPPLVLYDNPRSSNALKVRFLLAELEPGPRAPRGAARRGPGPTGTSPLNPVGGIPASRTTASRWPSRTRSCATWPGARRATTSTPPPPASRRAWTSSSTASTPTFRPAFFRHEAPALGYARDKGGFGAVPPDPERAAAVEVEIQPTLRLLDGWSPRRRRARALHDRRLRPGPRPLPHHPHGARPDPAPHAPRPARGPRRPPGLRGRADPVG